METYMDKVYIVMCSDAPSYGDSTWIHAVFSDEVSANKCAEINTALEEENGYSYYVREEEVKSSYDLDTRVVEYYSYFVGKEHLYKDIIELRDIYFELTEYLEDKGYLTEEFKEVEKNDNSQTEWGTKAHKESLSYIKTHLNGEQQKEVLKEMNKPEYRWENDEEPEKRIYKGDLDIEETDDYIQVFSINSFEEAKTTALDFYEKWLKTQ